MRARPTDVALSQRRATGNAGAARQRDAQPAQARGSPRPGSVPRTPESPRRSDYPCRRNSRHPRVVVYAGVAPALGRRMSRLRR
uniref:Uncharacterized protein n=1 Tax=Zea mays TaxID=4577 RepID=B6TKX8_MAIZE|nr:hypothetical protein [Zea mays]